MSETTPRPDYCDDAHLRYLDSLRESGITNMFGASPFLYRAFKRSDHPLDRIQARRVLIYWMDTFAARHRKEVSR